MNLPNKLTILRVIMIPFFVFFLLFRPEELTFRILADVLFCLASLTDLLDGRIARKYHLVTNFGKFMDPLADKLLVSAALVCLTSLSKLPAWITILIISREFIISGFRLIAATDGIVIAASMWGKAKTVSQMAMIIVLVLDLPHPAMQVLGTVLIIVATALTLISLLDYVVKNKDVLKEPA